MFKALIARFRKKAVPAVPAAAPAAPAPPEERDDAALRSRSWIMLADGNVGYVHHTKADGTLGVRPVCRITGRDLPNKSEHWSFEDRKKIPHEVCVHMDSIRVAREDEIPELLKRRGNKR